MNKLNVGLRFLGILTIGIITLLTQADATACISSCIGVDQLVGEVKVVVKARILETDEELDIDCGTILHFTAEVLEILKTDGLVIPNSVKLDAIGPIWPTHMGVSFREQMVVMLFLARERDGNLFLFNDQRAVLPTCGKVGGKASETDLARQIYQELKCVLENYGPYSTPEEIAEENKLLNEKFKDFYMGKHGHHFLWPWGQKDPASKAELLLLVSEQAPVSDLNFFQEFKQAPEPEIREAAEAALLRLDPSPERIAAVAKEMAASPDSEAWKKGHSYVFRVMDAVADRLQGRNHENMRESDRNFLPLYRTYTDRASLEAGGQYTVLDALDRIATDEDLPRLFRLCASTNDHIRLDSLYIVARILGIHANRPNSSKREGKDLAPEVIAWERETRKAIEPLLVQRGIKGTAPS